MNNIIDDMLDISQAIDHTEHQDLYNLSISLFKSLGFPVTTSIDTANIDIYRFIYIIAEKRMYLSNVEMELMENVHSISYLFKIDKGSYGLQKVRTNIIDGHRIESIIFLAVELEGAFYERSYNAYYLTHILNKCFSSLVFIMFRHCNEVLFAGQINFNPDAIVPNILMSDWISMDINDVSIMENIIRINLGYQKQDSFYNIYCNILWSISREYIIYPESEEYIKYGVLTDEHINSGYIGKDYYPVCFNGEKARDQIANKRSYYHDLYGSDYITEEEQTIIDSNIGNESELTELYDSFLVDSLVTEIEFYDDEIELDNKGEIDIDDQDYDEDFDITDIDQSYFDNPIKLMGFFEDV